MHREGVQADTDILPSHDPFDRRSVQVRWWRPGSWPATSDYTGRFDQKCPDRSWLWELCILQWSQLFHLFRKPFDCRRMFFFFIRFFKGQYSRNTAIQSSRKIGKQNQRSVRHRKPGRPSAWRSPRPCTAFPLQCANVDISSLEQGIRWSAVAPILRR